MSWEIKFNEESCIIEITYSGYITGQDINEATKARISMQEKTGSVLILADASQTLSGPSTMDLYNLPDKIYPENKARRDTRIAFVLPEDMESRNLALFFKTAARNRGWIIEVFENRKKALSWLDIHRI